MINWREYPFIRLLIPLTAGILLAFVIQRPLVFGWAISASLLLIIIYFSFIKTKFEYRSVYGVLLTIFIFLTGYQLAHKNNNTHRLQGLTKVQNQKAQILLTVTGQTETPNWFRLEGTVDGISGVEYTSSEKLLTYVEKDKISKQIRYGDQLLINTRIHRITGPKNPLAFDFSHYWNNQQYYYQTFLKRADWQCIQRDQGYTIIAVSNRIRQRFVDILDKHLGPGEEKAVGTALILGQKDFLSTDLKSAYANTGAMHVLAVSGLHVGLVYLGFSFLLGFVRIKSRSWVLFKTGLLIAGVWFFALLTGATPSVLRAATMFSFIIFGRAMRHHPSIYNTLAASAFFLLCLSPGMIRQVGFQLSYLAVTGIIYFQPKIYTWLYFKEKPLDYIWSLTSVALAAQLTTIPISLFYFHQFPVYFWLSGLIVIPAAVIILGLGILLLAVELVIPFFAFIPGLLLYWTLFVMNSLIYTISHLPVAILDGIWISPLMLILLYLVVVAVILAINTRQFRWLKITTALFFLLGLNIAARGIQRVAKNELVIYHSGNYILMDLISGGNSWRIRSKDLPKQQEDFAAKNYQWSMGIKNPKIISIDSAGQGDCFHYQNKLLQFKDLKLQIIGKQSLPIYQIKPDLDYVLLTKNTTISIDTIQQYLSPKQYLFGADNEYKNINRWAKICQQRGLPFFDIKKEGAKIIKIN